MSDLTNVTYCGLYCLLCATKSRIPRTAAELGNTLSKDGWDYFGEYILPGFKAFRSVLNQPAEYDGTCPDCRGGCGDPGCIIRNCAKERNIELCPHCEQYPCDHINEPAKRYPNLIADGKRLGEIGVEAWIEEQEERRR